MNEHHIGKIAGELKLAYKNISATATLLDEGATIPFIARYRKEVTGSLDEVSITAIRDRLDQLAQLDDRREAICKSLQERNLLTDALKEQLDATETMAVLEDLYLPFRPKRRTRAIIAREKGLEPLAQRLFSQDGIDPVNLNPLGEASCFIDVEKGVISPEEALAGARDIIAEWVSEDAPLRSIIRDLLIKKARISSKVITGKELEGAKYRDYYDWEEPVGTVPSHRILAMRRGEREGFLVLRLVAPDDEAFALLKGRFVKGDTPASGQVREALEDGYQRLLFPSMETEVRMVTKERADEEAIRVFAENLRQLLLAPPLGEKNVLAIDPGFRTGCKVVCLDRQGKLLHTDTIFPHKSKEERSEAAE
ncbi:MAG: yugI, partial [Deltaproteobacteria bacterium]|nr:yugI [Deltaproteobacteria bacterium]